MRTIRIDVIDDVILERFEEFIQKFDMVRYYIVIEKAKKTKKKHIQGVLDIGDYKPKDLINYITRHILKGFEPTKGKYSLAEVKELDKYMIYLSKGDEDTEELNVYKMKGYTTEDIERYRYLAIQQQQSYKASKEQKKKQEPLGKKYLRYLDANKDYFFKENILYRKELLEKTIDFFGEETKKFRSFLIEEFYNLAEYHYSPDTLKYRIMKQVSDSICFHNLYPVTIKQDANVEQTKSVSSIVSIEETYS